MDKKECCVKIMPYLHIFNSQDRQEITESYNWHLQMESGNNASWNPKPDGPVSGPCFFCADENEVKSWHWAKRSKKWIVVCPKCDPSAHAQEGGDGMGSMSSGANVQSSEYALGHADGFEDGFSKGYNQGYENGLKASQKATSSIVLRPKSPSPRGMKRRYVQ